MSEPPTTAEALLAIRDPRELFPDEPDARRRAYLKLVRQFRPEREPEAFAHLRALYEEVEPAAPANPTPHRADPSAARPTDLVVEALRAGRLREALATLTVHEAEVFGEQRGVWSIGWRVVLGEHLPELSPALAAHLAGRIGADGEDANEQELDRLLDLRLAVDAIAGDPRVPAEVRAALGTWRPTMSKEQAADALEAIGRATADLEAADALWEDLAARHPGGMVVLWELGRVVRRGCTPLGERAPIDPRRGWDATPVWILAMVASGAAIGLGVEGAWIAGPLLVAAFLVVRWVFALDGDPFDGAIAPRRLFWCGLAPLLGSPLLVCLAGGFPGIAISVGLIAWVVRDGTVAAWVETHVVPRAVSPGARRRSRSELEQGLRDAGAWPNELAELLTPFDGSWPELHPVPEVAGDPGALARVIGPAHRARWVSS